MPYLTPDTLPADTICRVLFVPDTLDWLAQITGALQELTFAYNWEAYGAITPEQAAAAMTTMFDAFCFNEGSCRVVGEIILYAGALSPDIRWLLCDGASLLRADYAALFAIIGTTFGSVDGTHFNLPDLRDRVPIGAGANALGAAIGEASHTLIEAEMPAHAHTESAASLAGLTYPLGGTPYAFPSASITGSAGGGGAHNNIQPSLALNYYIVTSS